MLMRVETRFRLLDYPGFAMLFFLIAVGGAIWLAVNTCGMTEAIAFGLDARGTSL